MPGGKGHLPHPLSNQNMLREGLKMGWKTTNRPTDRPPDKPKYFSDHALLVQIKSLMKDIDLPIYSV